MAVVMGSGPDPGVHLVRCLQGTDGMPGSGEVGWIVRAASPGGSGAFGQAEHGKQDRAAWLAGGSPTVATVTSKVGAGGRRGR